MTDMASSSSLPMPARLARWERGLLPLAAAGLLLLAVGFLTDPTQFFRSYLFGYVFWAGVALGCLSVSLLSHLTGGMWGLFIRRFLEAGTRTFPVLALLFLPVAFGVERIYSWTQPGDDPVLREKAAYLNVPFFLGRAAFYFAVWMLLLAFTMLWAYVNFSQFLIVWSGNISEETPFYLHRLQGGWQQVSLLLLDRKSVV